jgi:hypothetical protein
VFLRCDVKLTQSYMDKQVAATLTVAHNIVASSLAVLAAWDGKIRPNKLRCAAVNSCGTGMRRTWNKDLLHG